MGCSCLPLTKSLVKMTCWREGFFAGEDVNFTSIDQRVKCLSEAFFMLCCSIISPVCAVIECKDRYTQEESNPLDALIMIITAPIFFLLGSLRCLLGALIHPGIALEYTPGGSAPAPAAALAAH